MIAVCSMSCKPVGGSWHESECMFRENLNCGMSMSRFGIATSSCEILYNKNRRASDLRSARLNSPILMFYRVTNARGVMNSG